MYSKVDSGFGLVSVVGWLASIWAFAGVSQPQEQDKSFSNITIYYQTYCPRSIKFITQEFYPVFDAYSFSNLTVKMAPVSNMVEPADGNGTFVFNCSHGPDECYGNRVHVCVLMNNGPMVKKMKFINCTMLRNATHSTFPTAECAKEAELDIAGIDSCLVSAEVNETLYQNWKEYQRYNISIPLIVLNGK